jgi:hypothetical protein
MVGAKMNIFSWVIKVNYVICPIRFWDCLTFYMLPKVCEIVLNIFPNTMHHFERLSNFGCTFNFFASKWTSSKNFEIRSKQCISFPLFNYFNYTNQNKKAINLLGAQIRTWGNYKLIETSPIIHHFSKNYIFYSILWHSIWDLHATFPKFLKMGILNYPSLNSWNFKRS